MVKKEPVTPESLSRLRLVGMFDLPEATLANVLLCTLAMCLIGFAGFFHFDELAKLKESDVNFLR